MAEIAAQGNGNALTGVYERWQSMERSSGPCKGTATPRLATDQLGHEPLRLSETAHFMAKAQQP